MGGGGGINTRAKLPAQGPAQGGVTPEMGQEKRATGMDQLRKRGWGSSQRQHPSGRRDSRLESAQLPSLPPDPLSLIPGLSNPFTLASEFAGSWGASEAPQASAIGWSDKV